MHEFSIVKQEVQRVLKEAKGKRVSKIFFNLGRLAHGTPESIKEAFSLSVANTPLFGAEVIVNVIDPKIECSSCGYEFVVEGAIQLKCPKCSSSLIEIISGNECFISHLEVEG